MTAIAVAPARRQRAHPLAWWGWALALAVALTRISNPIPVLLLALAVIAVVYSCRGDDRWGRAFVGYLILAAAVVLIRLGFFVVVGIGGGGPVLVDLPRLVLPEWVGGIELFGPISVPGLLAALYSALALAALLLCFGAANALVDPVRALRSLPAALHPLGTAAVVAVTVAPRLVTSLARVRRAQRLRASARVRPGVRAIVVPVLSDALDHALALAASMDSRGYARTGGPSRATSIALMVALAAAVVGSYGLLDAAAPAWLGLPLLLAGSVVAVAAGIIAGHRAGRTRYRQHGWHWRDTATIATGVAAAAVALASPALRQTGLPGAPAASWAALVLAALAALPIWWWRR
ncbi:MAG: energy-coupling factor transporter transmembrane protein EcfT [Beutenbergiaceae bacterium]